MDYEKKIREYMVSSKVDQLYKSMLINLFPELKESEDERIRKDIISYVKRIANTSNISPDQIKECNAWIAWLEKQGEQRSDDIDNKFIRMRETKPKDISEFLDRLTTVEQEFLWEHIAKIRELDKEEQKPTDKVEPKFKVGDTITDPTDSTFTFHINAIKDGKYMESDKDWILIKEADSDYELVEQKTIKWSEEDEKEVAVLEAYIRSRDWSERHIDRALSIVDELVKKLKSLRPQSQWKPSDEQMTQLKKYCPDNRPLTSLYEQLKKLKGE